MLNRRLLATAALAISLLAGVSTISAKSQSQTTDLTGSYTVTGTNPSGTTYTGSLQISPSKGTVANGTAYQLAWKFGSDTSAGLGVLYNSNTFAVTFGTSDCVLNIYDIQNNSNSNSVSGIWANISAQNFGTETLTFDKSTASDHIAATYKVDGTNPDNSTYSGTMTLDGYGLLYDLSWTIAGQTNQGVGLLLANPQAIIAANVASASAKCSVASYQVVNGDLYGTWVSVGDKVTGTELALKNS